MKNKKYPSFIKLQMTDEEYLDFNALMDNKGIDINDVRAITVEILKLFGAVVSKE
jgi:hypothetical protein